MLSSVSIGFREIGRKLRRRKLRRSVKANLHQQAAQTVSIGERAWSSGFDLSGSEQLRSELAVLEQDQSAVASKRASIDGQKADLEQERSKEASGLDARCEELDTERRSANERVSRAKKTLGEHKSGLDAHLNDEERGPDALKAQELRALVSVAEAELSDCTASLKSVDDKLREVAKERKEVVGALDKKISKAQKAIADTQREDVALGSRKSELLSALGQMIIERRAEDASLTSDSPVVEELEQLAAIEAERAGLETKIVALQAETNALPAGVMGRFYGLVTIGFVVLALLAWLSWFLFGGGEREGPRQETRTVSSSSAAREERGGTATSRSTRNISRRSDSDLDELLETLQSGDVEEKAVAGRALGEIGENAVAPALEVLESNDQEQRANAAFALAEMVDLAPEAQAEVTPPLVEALKDNYWRARANAAIALGNLRNGDSDAFGGLRSTLSDDDPRVRAAATYAIGELGVDPAESVPVLAERLAQDEVPDVRVVAANALAMTGAAEAVPALQRAVEDEHWEVSYASMSALGLLRENAIDALPVLIDATARLPRFRAIVPAQSVKMILEGAGPAYNAEPEILSALSQRLDTIVRAVTLTDQRYGCPAASSLAILMQWLPSERPRIAAGLARLPSQRQEGARAFIGDLVLPAFVAMAEVRNQSDSAFLSKLEDPDRNVRWAAASALGFIDSERAIPALAAALADEDAMVQVAAARSLAHLDPESVGVLVDVLGHENPAARVHAAFALASIGRGAGEEDVVPALRDALRDDEFRVRYAMSCALKNIQRIAVCDPESILAPAGWRGR